MRGLTCVYERSEKKRRRLSNETARTGARKGSLCAPVHAVQNRSRNPKRVSASKWAIVGDSNQERHPYVFVSASTIEREKKST